MFPEPKRFLKTLIYILPGDKSDGRNHEKIKLMKLYELLQKETDSEHTISRTVLCHRLIDMGISGNIRTLSKDIDMLNANDYEMLSTFCFLRKCSKKAQRIDPVWIDPIKTLL